MEKENTGDCHMKSWIEETLTLILLGCIGWVGVLFLVAMMPQ